MAHFSMEFKFSSILSVLSFILLTSCLQNKDQLVRIEATEIPIDSTISEVDSIASYVAPFRKRIKQVLDSTLAYAPYTLTKRDGKYNTSAGNFMADVIYSEANPIFQSRTGKTIDFVLLNHGGIRGDISMGPVNARTAYEIMPFENTIVVVEMPGASVLQLVEYLIRSKRAHPFSQLQVVLAKDETLKEFTIQGKPFDVNSTYYVATSNYLVSGGDNMHFFKGITDSFDTNYLIRNAIIDYLKKIDTLKAKVDNRYIKLN